MLGKFCCLSITHVDVLTKDRVWYRPGMEVKYLEALRQRQGSLLFANSDWAAGGWRGFIDGAIQAGTEAAFIVATELRRMKATQANL